MPTPPCRKVRVRKAPAISARERLDYAWKHFALIADQRMKTFNFYLLVLLAAFGGTITLLQRDLPRHDYCMVGFVHIAVAVIFWAIDSRSCRMLGIAVDALAEIEASNAFQGYAKLMLEDRLRNKKGLWHLLSYRAAFKVTFGLQIIFGLALASNPLAFSTAAENPRNPQQLNPAHTAPIQPSEGSKGHSYEVHLFGSDHRITIH